MQINAGLMAQRRLEWWLSSHTVFWGAFLLVFPASIDGHGFLIMRMWAPAPAWGSIAAAVGMFHLWALVINGRRPWSPHVRAAATACNAAVFTFALAAVSAAAWHDVGGASALVAPARSARPSSSGRCSPSPKRARSSATWRRHGARVTGSSWRHRSALP